MVSRLRSTKFLDFPTDFAAEALLRLPEDLVAPVELNKGRLLLLDGTLERAQAVRDDACCLLDPAAFSWEGRLNRERRGRGASSPAR